MKKYIMIFSFFMLLSCSNDNNLSEPKDFNAFTTANSKQSKSEDETDAMFAAYVRSAIYIETQKLIHQFTTDLNGLVIPADADIVEWISKNIQQTNFKNIAEARQQWIQLTESQRIEIQRFAPVYEYMANAPLAEVKYYIHKWIIQNIKQNTNSSCEKKLNVCMNKALDTYIRIVAHAINTKGLTGSHDEVGKGRSDLETDTKKCSNEFAKCITK